MALEDIGHWPPCRCDTCGFTTWGDVPVMGEIHQICGGRFAIWDDEAPAPTPSACPGEPTE